MHTVSLEDFQNCYKPICNECAVFPNGRLKDVLGEVIWDKRDYSRIASHLMSKTIWTIKRSETGYDIIAGIIQNLSHDLIGYVVTEVPYTSNDTFNLKLEISN